MRIFYFLLLFLVFSSSFITAQPRINGCHHGYQHASVIKPFASEKWKAMMQRSDTFDIIDYQLDISVIDFSNQRIYARCEVKFTSKMNQIGMIPFDLLKFQIDSIKQQQTHLAFTYDSLTLNIQLLQNLQMGDTSSIQIWYQGRPTPDPSWGGFKFDGSYAYNLGIGLNSNPYNMGRSWFPCFDNFVERATMGINISSKLPKRGYAIGTFLGEQLIGLDTVIRSYRMNQPVTTYISHMAVSEYAQVDYVVNGLNYQLVSKSADSSAMKNTFSTLPAAVDALSFWWGPYPWERVGYIITPQGAMEHPTSIAYPRSTAVGGNSTGHQDLMSHELGHCWWGDLVTLKEPNDMWIKEGNAEYSGHLFGEFQLGRQIFIDKVKTNFRDVLRTAHLDDGGFQPLSGIPYQYTYGTHTYYKGAAMIHNMRAYLGDSLFGLGQRSVLQAFPYSAINAAEYRDQLTLATGKDMTDFFDAWIYQPGYSAFEVNKVTIDSIQSNQFILDCVIEQKLRGTNILHKNVPIQISFYDTAWNKISFRELVNGKIDTIQITCPFRPVYWVVNEENLLNLAQLHHSLSITSTLSNFTLPYADFVLNTNAVQAIQPYKFIAEHYWVAPDSIVNNPLGAQISNSHYWRVGGSFGRKLPGTMRFEYNAFSAPRLDADLVTVNEDSLILLYRPNPEVDWIKHPYYTKITLFNSFDGNGFIRVDSLYAGEYAFANGSLPMITSQDQIQKEEKSLEISFFPNPVRSQLHLQFSQKIHTALRYQIFNLSGSLLLSGSVTTAEEVAEIDLSNFENGVYLIHLSDDQGNLIENEIFTFLK